MAYIRNASDQLTFEKSETSPMNLGNDYVLLKEDAMKNNRRPYPSTFIKSIDTCKDPYLLNEGNHDMDICKQCHAIYHNKRWYLDEELYAKNIDLPSAVLVTCPACQKIKDKFPGGIVTLTGEFLQEHKNDIINLDQK